MSAGHALDGPSAASCPKAKAHCRYIIGVMHHYDADGIIFHFILLPAMRITCTASTLRVVYFRHFSIDTVSYFLAHAAASISERG